MKREAKTRTQLIEEIEFLENRLTVAEETLQAIREGEVDALYVEGSDGDRIYTLKGADHTYRTLIEDMHQGAVTTTTDGTILYANPAFAEMIQAPHCRIVGSAVGQYIVPEDRSMFEALCHEGLQGNAAGEVAFQKGKASAVHTYVSLNRVVLDDEPVLCITTVDLTEQKRHETLLRSEAFLCAVLDGVGEAVLVCDQQTRIIRANPAAQALVSWPVMGKSLNDAYPLQVISHDQDEGPEAFPVSHVLKGNGFKGKMALLTIPAREDRYFLLSATPLRNGKEVMGCVLVLTEMTDHKKLEMALDAEREQIAVTLLSIGDGVISTDLQGRVQLINPVAERITGWSQTEAKDRPLKDIFRIVHEKTREPLEDPVQKVLKTGAIVGLGNHTVLISRDGAEKALADSAAPLIDSSGNTFGVVLAFRDVTEKRRVEEDLRESEARYRDLVENSRDLICTHDLDGRILSANPASFRVMGYDPAELSHVNIYDILVPKMHSEFKAYANEIQRNGSATGLMRVRTRSGEERIWEYHNSLRTEGVEKPVVRAMARDVTEKIHAEKALRESEKRYRLLAENTVDCIWAMNMDLVFTYINPAIYGMTGFTPKEWIGSTLQDHCDRENFEKMARVIQAAVQNLTGEKGIALEAVELKKSGDPLSVEIIGKVLLDEAGKPVGLQGVTRDITDRKRTEKEREKLQAQLLQAQKMESVGRLAGGVAHDFNNHLQTIIGYAELAMDQVDKTSQLYSDIEQVQNAAKRSTNIIRQLLAFARKQTIAPVVLDLNDAVSSMIKMLRRLIGENIDLIWMPGADLWKVNVDPGQVDQVLANLVVNARDAIKDVGKVEIVTENRVLDQAYCVDHPGSAPGEYMQLTVRDTGCGMDRETLENIFEPFFTTKDMGKGTGLGLPTVYGIVKQNNGYIEVESEPGKGSVFKIYLPRHMGTKEEMMEDAPLCVLARGVETVLVVEDRKAVLNLTSRMLTGLGYTVLTAGTPIEAIRLSQNFDGPIHLILTDVILPQLNGQTLAGEMRKTRPEIQCLYMSGYTEDVVAKGAVLKKGIHFIQKPFTLEELARKVREALFSKA